MAWTCARTLSWGSFAVLFPLLGGCVAVAAASVVGLGFVQYQRNEAFQDFSASLQETWTATLEALDELGLEPFETDLGPTEGAIVRDEIAIRVERHPEAFTRVSVRVGTFTTSDHRRRARLILHEIERELQRSDELEGWKSKVESLSEPEPEQVPPVEIP